MPDVSDSCWISEVVMCVGSGWRRSVVAMMLVLDGTIGGGECVFGTNMDCV